MWRRLLTQSKRRRGCPTGQCQHWHGLKPPHGTTDDSMPGEYAVGSPLVDAPEDQWVDAMRILASVAGSICITSNWRGGNTGFGTSLATVV